MEDVEDKIIERLLKIDQQEDSQQIHLASSPTISRWIALSHGPTSAVGKGQNSAAITSKKATKSINQHRTKDCRYCRSLAKSCAIDCKNRIPFNHLHLDIHNYIVEYRERYSTCPSPLIGVIEHDNAEGEKSIHYEKGRMEESVLK